MLQVLHIIFKTDFHFQNLKTLFNIVEDFFFFYSDVCVV